MSIPMPAPPDSAAGLAGTDLGTTLAVGLWVMLAAALAIGGVYVALAVKRWVRREGPAQSFTLQELRELRARNEITEQEFTALRAALLGRPDPAALPGRSEPPPPAPRDT